MIKGIEIVNRSVMVVDYNYDAENKIFALVVDKLFLFWF